MRGVNNLLLSPVRRLTFGFQRAADCFFQAGWRCSSNGVLDSFESEPDFAFSQVVGDQEGEGLPMFVPGLFLVPQDTQDVRERRERYYCLF